MNEKILSNKKNGMGMLLLFCLLYLIAIAGCVLSAIALEHEFDAPPVIAGLVVSIIWLTLLLMSIQPVTERLMREVSVAPVRLLQRESVKKFRQK